jgi:hypothetical protein
MQAEFWYKIKLYGGGTAIIVVGLLHAVCDDRLCFYDGEINV